MRADNSVNYGTIRRVFQVDGFGIYNTDYPFNFNNVQRVTASFSERNGQNMKVDIAYHIDRKKNTLIAHYIYNSSGQTISFDPASDNILFVVLPGQQLAVFNEDDFRKMDVKDKNSYTFELTRAEKKFKTVKEVQDYLGLEKNS